MDYCFLEEACGVCGDEEETTDPVDGKRKTPILVAYNDVKGAFWTLKVLRKGQLRVLLNGVAVNWKTQAERDPRLQLRQIKKSRL